MFFFNFQAENVQALAELLVLALILWRSFASRVGGVDTLDQLCHAYTVQRRTNRWPFAFFMNLINVAGVAANVIYKTTFQVQSSTKLSQRKKFLHDLTEQLVHEQIKRRSRIGLYRLDQLNLDNIVGPSTDEPGPSGEPPAKAARRRCYICPSNRDRKVKQCCEKCKKNVCNDHAVTSIICSRCRAYMNTSDSLWILLFFFIFQIIFKFFFYQK